MTTPKAISFVAGIFLLGYMLSFIADGVWFGAQEQEVFASLTVLKTYEFLWFKIPWVNWDFFTVGLPRLFTFQFGFFGGELAFFKYLLYVVSIGIIWGLVATAISVIAGFVGRIGVK